MPKLFVGAAPKWRPFEHFRWLNRFSRRRRLTLDLSERLLDVVQLVLQNVDNVWYTYEELVRYHVALSAHTYNANDLVIEVRPPERPGSEYDRIVRRSAIAAQIKLILTNWLDAQRVPKHLRPGLDIEVTPENGSGYSVRRDGATTGAWDIAKIADRLHGTVEEPEIVKSRP